MKAKQNVFRIESLKNRIRSYLIPLHLPLFCFVEFRSLRITAIYNPLTDASVVDAALLSFSMAYDVFSVLLCSCFYGHYHNDRK